MHTLTLSDHTLSDTHCQIRRRVGRKITIRLILATVMSRIDCCNSALAGLPQSTLAPLQRVQNAAARLVFELGAREHVIPSLLQLHWLPVHWRIQYKLCYLMRPQTYLQRPSSWGRATAGRQDVVSHVHTAMRKVYSLHSSSRQM